MRTVLIFTACLLAASFAVVACNDGTAVRTTAPASAPQLLDVVAGEKWAHGTVDFDLTIVSVGGDHSTNVTRLNGNQVLLEIDAEVSNVQAHLDDHYTVVAQGVRVRPPSDFMNLKNAPTPKQRLPVGSVYAHSVEDFDLLIVGNSGGNYTLAIRVNGNQILEGEAGYGNVEAFVSDPTMTDGFIRHEAAK